MIQFKAKLYGPDSVCSNKSVGIVFLYSPLPHYYPRNGLLISPWRESKSLTTILDSTVVRHNSVRLSLRYSLQPTEQIPAWDTPHSIHSIAIERWIETDKLNSSWPEKYRFTGHRTKGRPANGQKIVNSLPESGWRQPVENPKCDLLWSLDLDFMLMVINENHTPTQLSLTLSVTLQPTIGCCFTWKKAH